MPAGQYDHNSFNSSYSSHHAPHYANESTASILKSVKAQDAQFDRLTKELETERQNVATRPGQYGDVSDTASMNSLSTADDTYNWRSPHALSESQIQDESLGLNSNSHLLDSCLRELEHRDGHTYNRGSMDYLHDNHYHGNQGHVTYDSYHPGHSPGMPNGGPNQYIDDERSPHGSRVSLHSTGSNRPRDSRGGPGSMSSLHRDQPPATYTSMSRPPYMEEHGSPHSPSTPTRFTPNHQYDPYSSNQLYADNSPRYSMASNDSFNRQMENQYHSYREDPQSMGFNHPGHADGHYPYGSGQHLDDQGYGHPPPDQYGGQPNYVAHGDPQGGDSFYRDSPVDRYQPGDQGDPYNDSYGQPGPMTMDNRANDPSYMDDRYRGHHPDDSVPEERFQNMSLNDPRHGDGRYDDRGPVDDMHGGPPPNDSFDNRPPGDSYGQDPSFGNYDDSPYRKHEGLPQIHSDPFADDPFQQKAAMEDDRYPGMPHDHYRDEDPYHRGGLPHPDDRYREDAPHPDDRYREDAPHPDDRYREEGPHPDDQYRDDDTLQRRPPGDDRYRDEDPYSRGPPPPDDGYGDDPYSRGPPPQGDRYMQDPYNRRTPSPGIDGRYDDEQPPHGYYDDNVRRSQPHLNAAPQDSYSDGRRTPSVQGDGSSWRPPDLQEVIDYLNTPVDHIKANAAAYLQHLCFNDDDMKAKARGWQTFTPYPEPMGGATPWEMSMYQCHLLENRAVGLLESMAVCVHFISGSQQTLLNEKFLESPSPNGGTTINGNELSSRSASRGHQQYQREEDIYLSPVGYKVSYQFENSDKTRPLHVAVPDRPNRSDSLRYSDLIDKVKLIDKYRSQSLPRLDNSQKYRSKSLPRLETGDMNGSGSRYERKGSAGQSDINGNVFKPIYVPKGDENMRVNLTKRDSVPRSRGRPKDRVARRRQSQSLPRRKNSNPDLQSLPGKNDFHYKSLPQLSGDRPGSSSGRYVTSESLNSMEKASRSNTMPNLHSASHLLSKTNLDYFSREELLTSLYGYQPHSIPNIEKNHGSTAITKLGQSSQSKSPRNRPYNIGNEAVGYDKPSSHQYPRSFSDSDVKRMDGGFLVDETFGMSSFTNGEIQTARSRDDSFGMERLNQPRQQGTRPFIGGSSPEDRDVTGDDVSLPQYYRQRPRIQDYFPAMPVDYSVRSAMNDDLNMPLGTGGSYHRPPAYQRQWSDITPTAEYMRELGYVVTTGRKPWSAWHARSSSIPGSSNRPMYDLRLLDRGMGAIPPLIDLINSDNPEVQRNACGVLKNLSFGKGDTGLRNKKQIVDAGGITALIRLLRRAQDEEVKELATGILWNLSSSEELKGKIIAEGLPEIVSRVIVPYSGWEQRGLMQNYEPWTTVYKNATGIIRNLSSANKDDEAKGYDTRNKLRECSKLVNCLVYTLKISQANKDRESKPVENCTCALRNLSFRIQEVVEQDFYKKRTLTLKKRQQPEKKDSPGCFGGGGKKKDQKAKGKPDLNQNAEVQLPPGAQEFQALWQPEAVSLYIDILKESSNPVTVEAAAGAIQNLTACYWKYADEIRSLVRKEKGLPALVDLLGQDRDSVVCHSALALRNLAIDEKNKELIGKYAMKQITFTLPMEKQKESVPDRTVCAVVALLHEVVKNSVDFAQLFTAEGGIVRLKFVKFSRGKFLTRTKEHTQTLLNALWEFKTLHGEYAQYGMTEQDFKREPAPGRSPDAVSPNSNFNTPYSTMSRPMESQGYDDNTLSPGRPMNKPYQPVNGRMDGYHGNMVQGHSNPAMNMEEPHGYDDRRRGEDIPMSDIAPGYAPLEERRDRRPPVGGVPLFPALQPQGGPGEPLYAQVNKNKRKDDMGPPSPNHVMLGDPNSPQGGADSWV